MSNRVDMEKPHGAAIVSVDESQVEAHKAMGYKIYEPDEPQSYDEIISQPDNSIQAAISQLQESDFSKSSGKPSVKAIEKVLGYDITAKQRDTEWEKYNG